MEDDFMTPGFWGPGFWGPIQDDSPHFNFEGGNISGPLSKGGRPQGSKNGVNKNANGHSGHYAPLTNQEKAYPKDLFYKKLKAAGGIHCL